MLAWIDRVFLILFVLWQAAPAIAIWPARATRVLSVPGTFAAAALVVLGNWAAWYIASHDPSSTAGAVFVVSPAYILGAQLLLAGGDFGIRVAVQAWGRRRVAGA